MNIYDVAIARALGSGGGGGGNPNTVQTVTGTLANPWGDIDVSKLFTDLENEEATAYLTIDASALGAGTIPTVLKTGSSNIYASGANIGIALSDTSAYYIIWYQGTLTDARMLSGGNVVDISSYASVITTSLTVVWHPLPSA